MSQAAQWPEWLTSVPLLFYSTVSCDITRSSLATLDISILVAMTLTIVCGFLLNFHQYMSFIPLWGYSTLLFISCAGMVSVFVLAFSTERQLLTHLQSAQSLNVMSDDLSDMSPREKLHHFEVRYKRLQYTMKKVSLLLLVNL